MTRVVLGIAVVVVAAVAAACGGSSPAQPATSTVTGRGVTVEIPYGWQPARHPISRVSDPREVLAVGTFELRYRAGNCDPFAGQAQQDAVPDGVFILLQESAPYAPEPGPRQFEPRPPHFGPDFGDRGAADCSRGAAERQWMPFRDGGRYFFAMLVAGENAPRERIEEAYGVLDSLAVDPAVRPDWAGSP